jgi:hypothetical protein
VADEVLGKLDLDARQARWNDAFSKTLDTWNAVKPAYGHTLCRDWDTARNLWVYSCSECGKAENVVGNKRFQCEVFTFRLTACSTDAAVAALVGVNRLQRIAALKAAWSTARATWHDNKVSNRRSRGTAAARRVRARAEVSF